MTTATIKPDAWRVSMGTTEDHNHWHYYSKKPKAIDDGEIWEPLYSASTLESLQRENEALTSGIKRLSDEEELLAETTGDMVSVVKLAAKLALSETHVNELQKANVAYVDANTALIRENEALKKDRDFWKEQFQVETRYRIELADRGTLLALTDANSRAEAAEAEVKRLTAPVTIDCRCTKIAQDETCPVGYPSLLCETCDGKGVLPYVELDGPELWEIVFGVNDDVAGEITDEQYDQIAKAINDVFISPLRARTALASTGGEHHAD